MDWEDYCDRNDLSPLDDDYFAEKMDWEDSHNPFSDDYTKEDYREE